MGVVVSASFASNMHVASIKGSNREIEKKPSLWRTPAYIPLKGIELAINITMELLTEDFPKRNFVKSPINTELKTK